MIIVATAAPLQVTALALVALGAPAVAFTRDTLRQLLVAGLYGYALALLFVVLQAPDVALSMFVVSSVAYPLVVLVAIARIRSRSDDEERKG